MKVLLLAADNGGCAKYRVREPARVTGGLVEVEVSSSIPVEASKNPRTNITTVHEIHSDADVIVFQRPLDNAMAAALIQAKKQGIATIVEMDDDIASTHPKNMAYPHFFGHKHTGVQWLWKATQHADFVIASTPALLKRYAPEGNGAVIRNCVPESIFDVTPRYERTDHISMLGWTGSVASHPTDLLVTKGAVGEVAKEFNMAFAVVGEDTHVKDHLRLDPETHMYSPGWLSLEDYYEGVANSMDIGIVPLELNEFNRSKSYLKGLEMAAVGIPFVASNTEEYVSFAEDFGIGSTAKDPSAWRRELRRLVGNYDKTVSLAKEYRDKIREEHTYEKNAERWVEAWDLAIQTARKNRLS